MKQINRGKNKENQKFDSMEHARDPRKLSN